MKRNLGGLGIGAALALLAGCQGTTPTIGSSGAKTVATGSAGGSTAQDANAQLERCSESLGTLAIEEDRQNNPFLVLMQQYSKQEASAVPTLRLMIQQSNCFVVVERGRAMNNMMMKRDMEQSGEIRAGSSFGKGQIVASDYTLIPSVTFNQRGTSQAGGAVGALVPIAGAVAGSIQTNDASTVLTLIDNRSGVQIAAAEGSARNMDFAGLGAMAAGFGALMGGKTKSPQEKILIAAFMDSYNQMVRAARNYQAQTVKGGLGTGGAMQADGAPTKPAR
jgi:hypothetical protein